MTESFESKGLPHFRRATDKSFTASLFYLFSTGTSILVGTFVASICDFITFVASLNASGIWFAYRCIIQLFSLRFYIDCFMNQNKTNSFRSSGTVFSHHSSGMIFSHRSSETKLFSPPNGGKIVLSKWQSANHAVNISSVKGSKYWMIDGVQR